MLSLFLSWALIQSVCPHTAVTNSPLMREAFRLDEPEVVLVPAAVSQYRLRNVPIGCAATSLGREARIEPKHWKPTAPTC
jgi:hypothetical protein